MTTTRIRAFARSDGDAIVALSLRAWAPVFASFEAVLGGELFARVHPDWHRDQAASVRRALEDNETWVAERRGGVVGFVNVIFHPDQSAEIHMIAVDPMAQRTGIASLLTDHALDEMRSRGVDLAIVATGGDPGHAPARATYEQAGFTPCPQVWYARMLR